MLYTHNFNTYIVPICVDTYLHIFCDIICRHTHLVYCALYNIECFIVKIKFINNYIFFLCVVYVVKFIGYIMILNTKKKNTVIILYYSVCMMW